MSLVFGPLIYAKPGPDLAWVTVVILVLVLVVVPAVWSRRAYRREAGRDVLASILRWRG